MIHRTAQQIETYMRTDKNLCEIVDRLLRGPMARHLRVRRVTTGQLIYGHDEVDGDHGLVVVRKGRLRCFVSFEGKELTLFMLDSGDAVRPHSGTTLEVKNDGEIVFIDMATFAVLAQSDPELALSVMPLMDRLLQESIRMIEDMAFHDVKHRLIRALCDAAERDGRQVEHGVVIDAVPRAEDFAMQIGATRQSVSTVMAELVRCGILQRFGGSSVVISDIGRLRRQLASVR